jgi:hypothetical protein
MIHPLVILRPGDVTWGWCSKCGTQQDKLYTGYSLVCLQCHPEKDPRKANQDAV